MLKLAKVDRLEVEKSQKGKEGLRPSWNKDMMEGYLFLQTGGERPFGGCVSGSWWMVVADEGS